MKMSQRNKFFLLIIISTSIIWAQSGTYTIVETGQETCYNNTTTMTAPSQGEAFYGQDAQYTGNTPSYTDNGDGTVTDNRTGLMWQKSPDFNGDNTIDYDDKKTHSEAVSAADTFSLAGHSDWRLPTTKELYSLIMFYGAEPNPEATSQGTAVPYIDTNAFDFAYGDINSSERLIDAQYAASTIYVSTTMGGNETMFGLNFADGRIKGYPTADRKKYYVMYVRGNESYGTNNFVDNEDGTVTDNATGLMWMQDDNGEGLLWENALSYAESLNYAGHSDWRLPNAKELQSIIDYTRSPAATGTAAIDSVFNCTSITNEGGETDFPFYWTGTTFSSQNQSDGRSAAYVCFGRGLGYMTEFGGWNDVHGAGAQRSDPKTGNPDDYPTGFGPQGDVIRIYNHVRCVRSTALASIKESMQSYPRKQNLNVIYQNLNSATPSITFSLNRQQQVTLRVYDIQGKMVKILFSKDFSAGNCQITWTKPELTNGLYFYRLSTDSYNNTHRVIHIK